MSAQLRSVASEILRRIAICVRSVRRNFKISSKQQAADGIMAHLSHRRAF